VSPGGAGAAAASSLVDELRAFVRSRTAHETALKAAVEAVGRRPLCEAMTAVVEPLPLVVEADLAMIRLGDEHGQLHLVGASGCPPGDVYARAVQPVDLHRAIRLNDRRVLMNQATALGLRWLELRWLGGGPVGLVILASRTDRRPQFAQIVLLNRIIERLTTRLEALDLSESNLRRCSLELARATQPVHPAPLCSPEVAKLRRRERTVLNYYLDGLSTAQIAAILVISRETVRTHVKTALRTLGVHSRAEAVELVRTSSMLQLI
jgi:DNA-binding CsgD family transcriptional regulator